MWSTVFIAPCPDSESIICIACLQYLIDAPSDPCRKSSCYHSPVTESFQLMEDRVSFLNWKSEYYFSSLETAETSSLGRMAVVVWVHMAWTHSPSLTVCVYVCTCMSLSVCWHQQLSMHTAHHQCFRYKNRQLVLTIMYLIYEQHLISLSPYWRLSLSVWNRVTFVWPQDILCFHIN